MTGKTWCLYEIEIYYMYSAIPPFYQIPDVLAKFLTAAYYIATCCKKMSNVIL